MRLAIILLAIATAAAQTRVTVDQAGKSKLFWWGDQRQRAGGWQHIDKSQVALPALTITADGTSVHVLNCVITAPAWTPIWIWYGDGSLMFTEWPQVTVTGCQLEAVDYKNRLFMYSGVVWHGNVAGGRCADDEKAGTIYPGDPRWATVSASKVTCH